MRIDSSTRALVTGASRGIGQATARALVARGARVGLVARGGEDLEKLAAELGDRASAHPADIAEREQISSAVGSFIEEAGGIDVLIANAGICLYAPFSEQDPDDAERMVKINVLGTINTVKAALDPMLDRASGHIVVVSSGAALRAFPWGAVYGATKAANKNFAEALRHELSGTGVSVTTVYPGEVETSIHEKAAQLPDWRKTDDEIPAATVAENIVAAIESDRREVHVPAEVRMLAINDLAPGLLDRLLAMVRGGAAAPRRY